MSSQRPRGESKIVVSCGFCQSTSTTNLERVICGLLLVLSFVTFSNLKRRNLRTNIHSKLLDSSISEKSSICPSTLFVSAALVEENEEIEEIEDVDIKVAPYGTVLTTPVTIWVGILTDTLTRAGEVAFHSSNDILDLLKKHGISNVDVVYHESVARGFSGPEVFAPVSDRD